MDERLCGKLTPLFHAMDDNMTCTRSDGAISSLRFAMKGRTALTCNSA